MKKAAILSLTLVALFAALAIFWVTSIDRVVQTALEHYGTRAFGTPVHVGAVTIRAREGLGTIEGLRIAQPEGFGEGDAVSFGEVSIAIDSSSLASADPVVIEEVRIGAPRVAYVIDAERRSNLDAIQQSVNAGRASDGPAGSGDEGGGRLLIRRLTVAQGRVEADLTALGIGRAQVDLPAMELRDVGGQDGASAGAVAAAFGRHFVAVTLAELASSSVGRRLDQLLDKSKGDVRSMLDALFPR